jgi:hypothetical protein
MGLLELLISCAWIGALEKAVDNPNAIRRELL